MSRMFFDDDADLSCLEGEIVGVFGYGNQGRAQALNLRDSGLDVVVGSRRDDSFDQAVKDGFPVYSWAEAAKTASILFLLAPDEELPNLVRDHISQGLEKGNMLVLASGFNIAFELLKPPEFVDVVMLAPRMIGQGVRDTYLAGESFPSLIAVGQDASGNALPRLLALAKGIGSTKMGVVLSSFAEEALVDLFTEQMGELYAIRRYFEVLVEAGCDPFVVLLELYASGEGVASAKAYRDVGLWGQLALHSRTSQYGQEVVARLSPEEEEQEKQRLRVIIEHIRSGRFAEQWVSEQKGGFPIFNCIRQQNLDHPLIHAERELYRMLKRRTDSA